MFLGPGSSTSVGGESSTGARSKRNADAMSEACTPSPKVARAASDSQAASSDIGGAELKCEACGERQAPKSRWCIIHRRAADNMYRSAMKGTTSELDTEQSIAFKAIFGARKTKHLPGYVGEPALAVKAVLDYIEHFPDGKEKATRTRGHIDLTQYTHKQGHRTSSDTVSRARMMDIELFTRPSRVREAQAESRRSKGCRRAARSAGEGQGSGVDDR